MAAEGKGRRRAQTLLGAAILLVLLVLGGMLWVNHQGDDLLPQIIEKLPENVDLGLERVHYSQNENGRRSWVLDADRAAYQRKEDELSLTGVKLTFFNAGDFGELRLDADQGVLWQKQKRIRLQGNVRVRTSRNQTFETEWLRYDFSQRLLTTDALVHLQGRQLELSGTGMVLDLTRGTMQILHNVHARLEQDDPKGAPQ